MFELEYEFRQQDLIHFNEIRIKNNVSIQNELRKHRFILIGLMLFIAFFYYLYNKDIVISSAIAVAGLVWALVIKPYESKLDMRRQILAKYTEAEKEAMFGVYHLHSEQHYLVEKSPKGKSHKLAWKDLVRVDYEGQDYVYIYVDLDSALIIPLDTISKGDIKQFAQHAEGMIERAS